MSRFFFDFTDLNCRDDVGTELAGAAALLAETIAVLSERLSSAPEALVKRGSLNLEVTDAAGQTVHMISVTLSSFHPSGMAT